MAKTKRKFGPFIEELEKLDGNELANPQCFAGPGCQLPSGGGRTAAVADAGLEVGIIPPPGPWSLVSVSDRGRLLGAHSAPAGTAGALPEKVGGGCRGA